MFRGQVDSLIRHTSLLGRVILFVTLISETLSGGLERDSYEQQGRRLLRIVEYYRLKLLAGIKFIPH